MDNIDYAGSSFWTWKSAWKRKMNEHWKSKSWIKVGWTSKSILSWKNRSSLGLSGSNGRLHVLLLPCALHLDLKRKLWWWKWLGLWRNYSSDIVFVCFCCVFRQTNRIEFISCWLRFLHQGRCWQKNMHVALWLYQASNQSFPKVISKSLVEATLVCETNWLIVFISKMYISPVVGWCDHCGLMKAVGLLRLNTECK